MKLAPIYVMTGLSLASFSSISNAIEKTVKSEKSVSTFTTKKMDKTTNEEQGTAQKFQAAKEALEIEKNKNKSIAILKELMQSTNSSHPLYNDIEEMYFSISDVENDQEHKVGVQFITGKKQVVFCKNLGIVELKAFHNNGDEARFVLESQETEFLKEEDYWGVRTGQFVYTYKTNYRDVAKTEFNVISGGQHHLVIKEMNENKKSKSKDISELSLDFTDAGKLVGRMTKNSHQGANEPSPIFSLTNYLGWGTPHLFHLTDLDSIKEKNLVSEGFENTNAASVKIKSESQIKEKFANYATTDFKGKKKEYQDCYLVETVITYDGIRRFKK